MFKTKPIALAASLAVFSGFSPLQDLSSLAIAQTAPRGLDGMISELSSRSADERSSAAKRISDYAEERKKDSRLLNAIPPLSALLNDQSGDVRWKASMAIAEIASHNPGNAALLVALQPLTDALNDESWIVRAYAAEALGELHDPRATKALLGSLSETSLDVRLRIISALSKSWPKDIPIVTKALGDEKARGDVEEILLKIGDPAVPSLIANIKTGNIRSLSLAVVARMREEQESTAVLNAVPATLEIVKNTKLDPELRVRAASTLAVLGDARPLPDLCKIMEKDHSSDVKKAAKRVVDTLHEKNGASCEPEAQM